MSTARYARAAFSTPSTLADEDLAVVAVLSDDPRYRASLADQLRSEGLAVLDGPATLATLRRVPYWGASWRASNFLRLVLLDLTRHASLGRDGMDLLDAVRRQDWSVPIILMVRAMGGAVPMSGRSFGANVVFEGQVPADELTATALRLATPRHE